MLCNDRVLPLRGVPKSLRLLNRASILSVLLEGPSTVPRIAARVQISPLTVAKILQELEEEGLISSSGSAPASPAGGKRARLWTWDGRDLFAAGVMLSVEGVRAAITDYQGTVIAVTNGTFDKALQPEEVEILIEDLIRGSADLAGIKVRELTGVGIGVPGLTDFEEGVLVFAPHLSGWRNVSLGDNLERRLEIPVFVDNEARVQALAERYFGLGRNSKSLLCVETGVGIAAALMKSGHIYRGETNTAGEVGHMIVDPNGPRCRCGSRGCWETLAGTGRLASLAGSKASNGVTEPYYDPSSSELGEIFSAAQRGDPIASSAVADVAHWFGVGLANLINIWNPEVIVVHGDLVAGGKQLLGTTIKTVHETALVRPAAAVSIYLSEMGENVGVIGAASLAIEYSMLTASHD